MLFRVIFAVVLVPAVVIGSPLIFADGEDLRLIFRDTPLPAYPNKTRDVTPRPRKRRPKCSRSDGELIYEPDMKCYKKGKRTDNEEFPCSDKYIHFEERHDKPGYGECIYCTISSKSIRPVVHWAPTKMCYWLFDQGPCEPGHWLILNELFVFPDGSTKKIANCERRTCPENEDKSTFWFESNGRCYKSQVFGKSTPKTEPVLIVNQGNRASLTKAWLQMMRKKEEEEAAAAAAVQSRAGTASAPSTSFMAIMVFSSIIANIAGQF